MSDWNIPKEYLDQSKEIERLKAKVAELEAEVKALWLEKVGRDNVANREVVT
jgi:cell division protein FtsB